MCCLLVIFGLFGGLVQVVEVLLELLVLVVLSFIFEYVVEGMCGGNFFGLVWCGGVLWMVFDCDDDCLYCL